MALTQVSSDGIKNLNVKTADLENSGVTAGTYGSASLIPALVIDAKGRVTSASTNAISTDLVNDSSPQLGAQLDTNGKDISHGDASKSKYGASNDLQIHHTSNHSTIENATGELRIKNTSGSDMVLNSTGRVQLQVANGEKAVYCDNNGAVELYYDNSKKLETYASGVAVMDNVKYAAGNSADLQIYHDGSNSYISDTGTGTLILNSNQLNINNAANDEHLARFYQDGGVELYYDASKKFQTIASGVKVSDGNLYLDRDNAKVVLGASDDLEIYHSGTQSYVTDQGTGNLNLQGSSKVVIGNAAHDENMAQFFADGAVELYYDNEKRFETLASGAKFSECNYIDLLAKEGQEAAIYVFADQGDDNADKWRIRANTSGNYYLENKASGSWETNYKAFGDGAVELYYDNTKRLETDTSGVTITGRLETTSNVKAKQDGIGFRSGASDDLQLYHDGTNSYLKNDTGTLFVQMSGSGGVTFKTQSGTNTWKVTAGGNFEPSFNNFFDIGSSSARVKNIYTNDLNLSNEGGSNDVDGTWGSYTIQEGAEDLFLVNKRNGKKYKFNLTEVS